MTSSKPNYLPKTPSPKTITLGLGLQHMDFGGTQIIRSIDNGESPFFKKNFKNQEIAQTQSPTTTNDAVSFPHLGKSQGSTHVACNG